MLSGQWMCTLSSDAKNVASTEPGIFHGSDQSSEDHPGCREAHVFSGFSWQVIQVDKSSILAGPAEDVVEKWPWLKAAEHGT